MTMQNDSDKELERGFKAARAAAPQMDASLTARIMDSAESEFDSRHAPASKSLARRGWRLADAFRSVGVGFGVAGGVAASAVLGVWLGFNGTLAATVFDQVAALVFPVALADVALLDDPFAGLDDNIFGE